VEATIQLSSLDSVVSQASTAISQATVPTSRRSRLLRPGCPGKQGTGAAGDHRRTATTGPHEYPGSACSTASVTSSASDNRNLILTAGATEGVPPLAPLLADHRS